MQSNHLLTPREAANRLGITVVTLLRRVRDREIVSVNDNLGRQMFRESDVAAALAAGRSADPRQGMGETRG